MYSLRIVFSSSLRLRMRIAQIQFEFRCTAEAVWQHISISLFLCFAPCNKSIIHQNSYSTTNLHIINSSERTHSSESDRQTRYAVCTARITINSHACRAHPSRYSLPCVCRCIVNDWKRSSIKSAHSTCKHDFANWTKIEWMNGKKYWFAHIEHSKRLTPRQTVCVDTIIVPPFWTVNTHADTHTHTIRSADRARTL